MIKYRGRAAGLALFFLLFCSVFSAETENLSDLKAKVDSLFSEYTDYVSRFSSEDRFAKNLYARYKLSSRKYELLAEREATPVLSDTDIDNLAGFDYRTADGYEIFEKPGAEADRRLAWLNYRFYDYPDALALFRMSASKAELNEENSSEALFGESMSLFMLAQQEPDPDRVSEYYAQCLEILRESRAGADDILAGYVTSLERRISIEKELLEISQQEKG